MRPCLTILLAALLLAGLGCAGNGGKKGDNSGKDMPRPSPAENP